MSNSFGSENFSFMNPREISEDEAVEIRRNFEMVARVKRPDCSFYNTCLEQAVRSNWAGFSCASCTGYSISAQFQREMDVLGLRAMRIASDRILEGGKLNRVRGIKQGQKRVVRAEAEEE